MDFFDFFDIIKLSNREGVFMFKNYETCFENVFTYPGLSDLNMYYCGKRVKTLNHSYGPEVREHFLIVYIKEGKGTLLSTKQNIRLIPGNILVMFPNEKIHYVVDEDQAWSISWVGVFGSQIHEFFDKMEISPEMPVFTPENKSLVEDILEKIYNLSFSDLKSDKIKAIGFLYEFFSSVMSEKDIKNGRNYVDDAINIIKYNYDKNISVETIAEKIFVNPSYLSRLFKAEKKISIKEYILQKKIERAKMLLERENVSVKLVANSVGFTDSLYFSRIFKKKTGFSPLEYKSKSISKD